MVFVIFTILIQRVDAETIRVPKDAKTIQGAIDRSQPGDTIEVGPGVYTESIVLKPNRILKSAGDDSQGKLGLVRAERTIINGGKQTKSSGVTLAEKSILDGFTILNTGTYDDAKWQKHFKTQGNEQPHDHIGRPSISGIRVEKVYCEVRNNIIHHHGYSGIVVMGASQTGKAPRIEANICFRNMGAGISLMKGTRALVSRNVCFENFYAGIGQNNAHPTIVHNKCYGNIRAGIGISNGSCPLVQRNQCYKNRRAGIGTRTGKKTCPTISNNDCFENDMAGIGTEEDASPVIVDNKCYRNKLAGIGCTEHSSPTIVSNQCYENGKAGIGCDGGAQPLIISNHCFQNKTSGIGFAACQKGRAKVLNNRLVNNAMVAMGVHPGWQIEVMGNYLERKNGMPPLVMVFKGSSVKFVDNELVGGGVAGIRCAGEVTVQLCKFTGTQFRTGGPPNFGVWGLPGSRIIIEDSNFFDWRHAVSASKSFTEIKGNSVIRIHRHAFSLMDPEVGTRVVGNQLKAKDAKQSFLHSNQLEAIEFEDNRIVAIQ